MSTDIECAKIMCTNRAKFCSVIKNEIWREMNKSPCLSDSENLSVYVLSIMWDLFRLFGKKPGAQQVGYEEQEKVMGVNMVKVYYVII